MKIHSGRNVHGDFYLRFHESLARLQREREREPISILRDRLASSSGERLKLEASLNSRMSAEMSYLARNSYAPIIRPTFL